MGFDEQHYDPEDHNLHDAIVEIKILQARLVQAEEIITAADELCGLLGTKEHPAEEWYSEQFGNLDVLIGDYKGQYGEKQ